MSSCRSLALVVFVTGLASASGCGSECATTIVTIGFEPRISDRFSGSVTIAGVTATLTDCPDTGSKAGEWFVYCKGDGLTISGQHVNDITEVTLTLSDVDGSIALDQVVPLGKLESQDSEGGRQCYHRTTVSLALPRGAPLSLTPTMMDFGSVPLGGRGNPATFTLSNSYAQPSETTAVNVEGDFTIIGSTCASSVPPNETCSFQVVFAPIFPPGAKSGRLSLANVSNPPVAMLSGQALPPDAGAP